jgi:hypothetical protein
MRTKCIILLDVDVVNNCNCFSFLYVYCNKKINQDPRAHHHCISESDLTPDGGGDKT